MRRRGGLSGRPRPPHQKNSLSIQPAQSPCGQLSRYARPRKKQNSPLSFHGLEALELAHAAPDCQSHPAAFCLDGAAVALMFTAAVGTPLGRVLAKRRTTQGESRTWPLFVPFRTA